MSRGKQERGPGALAARWLVKNNQVQHGWAYSYLRQRSFPFGVKPYDVSMYAWLKAEFERQPDTIELRFLLQKMKRAWSQKKLRSKGGGRKAYTYVLSESFGYKLGKLAKKHKLTAWEMLEKILEEYESVQNDLNLMGSFFKKQLDLDEREENIEKKEAEIERQFAICKKRESDEVCKKVQINGVEYLSRGNQELISQLLDDFEGALLELAEFKGDGVKVMIRHKAVSDQAKQAIQNRLKKYADLK